MYTYLDLHHVSMYENVYMRIHVCTYFIYMYKIVVRFHIAKIDEYICLYIYDWFIIVRVYVK